MFVLLLILIVLILWLIAYKYNVYPGYIFTSSMLTFLIVLLMGGIHFSRVAYYAEIENFKHHQKYSSTQLWTQWLIKSKSNNKNFFMDPFIPDTIEELKTDVELR